MENTRIIHGYSAKARFFGEQNRENWQWYPQISGMNFWQISHINYGTTSSFMGNSTISTGPCSIDMLVYQRVSIIFHQKQPLIHYKWPLIHYKWSLIHYKWPLISETLDTLNGLPLEISCCSPSGGPRIHTGKDAVHDLTTGDVLGCEVLRFG